MKSFEGINFLGEFRNYQQRVLDTSDKYLKNNKIHIVASPGSGKTILGLEIIRRLGAPCLVLSPTNTIKYQWGDRFESMFLKDEDVNDYVSYDLKNIKLITSITYQALHSAVEKVVCLDEENNEIDNSNLDLFKLVNDYGIKTICVDEAHHLQNEWQKSLETFIRILGKGVKVIALTATPPYDASKLEWERYIEICGEIDEEIFVPELVKSRDLCPHQDYIYLNYPTTEESIYFKEHRENVKKFLEEIKILKCFEKFNSTFLINKDKNLEDNLESYRCVCIFFNYLKVDIKERFKIINNENFLKDYEIALNYLICKETELLNSQDKKLISDLLKKYGLINRNKVGLLTNDKLDRQLILSIGKLESITKIVDCEYNCLNKDLRMLVLTDYIRKNNLSKIGTNYVFNDLSIVSIFEAIRKHRQDINIGVLSGELIILPSSLENDVRILLEDNKNKLKTKVLKDSGYSEYILNISNKHKVALVGKLFEDGKINIVVGTKSLLGEGWDSPCINSLIMASFVGSFMLSNQMRGRAIRVYKKNLNKSANIWHLVTLEPEKDNSIVNCNEETSADYKTLKRRFKCFVGPHYQKNVIEDGIERISILKNSYDKDSVDKINEQMEKMAVNREVLFDKWKINNNGTMNIISEIPNNRAPKALGIIHLLFPTLIYILLSSSIFNYSFDESLTQVSKWFLYIVSGVLLGFALKEIIKSIRLISSLFFVKCIAKSSKQWLEENEIISKDSKLKVIKNKNTKNIEVALSDTNLKEQKVFNNFIKEFFSYINEPRYIVCKRFMKKLVYKYSYQLPVVVSSNKQVASSYVEKLKILFPCRLVYVKHVNNRKCLFWAKKYNYIKDEEIIQKQSV